MQDPDKCHELREMTISLDHHTEALEPCTADKAYYASLVSGFQIDSPTSTLTCSTHTPAAWGVWSAGHIVCIVDGHLEHVLLDRGLCGSGYHLLAQYIRPSIPQPQHVYPDSQLLLPPPDCADPAIVSKGLSSQVRRNYDGFP